MYIIKNSLAILTAVYQLTLSCFSQDVATPACAPEILQDELKAKIGYLASDSLEGRMTGSRGIHLAADYLTAGFGRLGLKPFGDEKTDYRWPFAFVASYRVDPEANALTYSLKDSETRFNLHSDFIPLSSSENGSASGQVVFAGYGLSLDDKKGYTYHSYDKLDVKGLVVMVLGGIPDSLGMERKGLFEMNLAPGYRQVLAKKLGASAILIVDKHLNEARSREIVAGTGIISAYVSEAAANAILKEKNLTVQELEKRLCRGESNDAGGSFTLQGTISVSADVERIMGEDYNLAGMVASDDSTAPYILIGAHYDHIGLGETNSRSPQGHKNDVHNGADDNASGCATVMELAEYFAGLKKENPSSITANLVFCFWSGEEMGLLGSSDFAGRLPVPPQRIKAYLNFDMVGRMKDNELEVQGLASAEGWKAVFENTPDAGFKLQYTDDPLLPTDVTPFYLKRIPVVGFFTGIHDDYHTYSDDAGKINFPDLERMVKYVSQVVMELMKPETKLDFREVKARQPISRDYKTQVTLGTIPSFSGSENGFKLQGVKPGGPADKAGMKGGDLVISLDHKPVSSIYDYMGIMGEMVPGKEYEITVLREGKEVTFIIVPEEKQ
jgi:hypothetical protein